MGYGPLRSVRPRARPLPSIRPAAPRPEAAASRPQPTPSRARPGPSAGLTVGLTAGRPGFPPPRLPAPSTASTASTDSAARTATAYSRPTNVSNVASGGQAKRTGV
ncbi:hypothetical protein GCM10009787_43080 [Streptomyces bangladeshensis]|uniref:Uncharacterized protein n=1 Tax=Streptomyces bangladeshensis TaxID=295352 RepID=A0ABN3BPS2_9ACTN